MEFTYKGARAAVHGHAFGAGRLVEWRMRRACSRFEAWGAWPRSRFAARSANCLKVAERRGGAGARKKTAPFGKALVLTAGREGIPRCPLSITPTPYIYVYIPIEAAGNLACPPVRQTAGFDPTVSSCVDAYSGCHDQFS
jgi:hypothetical protein